MNDTTARTLEGMVRECASQKQVNLKEVLSSDQWLTLVEAQRMEALLAMVFWAAALIAAVTLMLRAFRMDTKTAGDHQLYHGWMGTVCGFTVLFLLMYGIVRGSVHVSTVINPERSAFEYVSSNLTSSP